MHDRGVFLLTPKFPTGNSPLPPIVRLFRKRGTIYKLNTGDAELCGQLRGQAPRNLLQRNSKTLSIIERLLVFLN